MPGFKDWLPPIAHSSASACGPSPIQLVANPPTEAVSDEDVENEFKGYSRKVGGFDQWKREVNMFTGMKGLTSCTSVKGRDGFNIVPEGLDPSIWYKAIPDWKILEHSLYTELNKQLNGDLPKASVKIVPEYGLKSRIVTTSEPELIYLG